MLIYSLARRRQRALRLDGILYIRSICRSLSSSSTRPDFYSTQIGYDQKMGDEVFEWIGFESRNF